MTRPNQTHKRLLVQTLNDRVTRGIEKKSGILFEKHGFLFGLLENPTTNALSKVNANTFEAN